MEKLSIAHAPVFGVLPSQGHAITYILYVYVCSCNTHNCNSSYIHSKVTASAHTLQVTASARTLQGDCISSLMVLTLKLRLRILD